MIVRIELHTRLARCPHCGAEQFQRADEAVLNGCSLFYMCLECHISIARGVLVEQLIGSVLVEPEMQH